MEPLINERPHGIQKITCVASHGRFVVTGGEDGRVILHTFSPHLKLEKVIIGCRSSPVSCLAMNESLVVAGIESAIEVYERNNDVHYQLDRQCANGIKDMVLYERGGHYYLVHFILISGRRF